MEALESLKPKLKRMARQLIEKCRAAGIRIRITEGLRTTARQNKLYAQGRTMPGKIVTCAKGGESLHNYGVAFDFCLIKSGKADWKCIKDYARVGAIGESIGLEWGGSWKKFRDYAHFQFTAGYSADDFKKKRADESKFK